MFDSAIRLFNGCRPSLAAAFTLLFTLLFLAPASSQNTPGDSIKIQDANSLRDTVVSLESVREGPRKALIWSILPGGGQAYNGRFWKVPIVYGGLLGMVAYADFNQTRYDRFVNALRNRCLGEGNIITPPFEDCIPTVDDFPVSRISNQALIQARDNTDRARQTAYIGIFVVYVLQAVEAYTDAHLQRFDISDDLSINLGPVLSPGVGIGYGLTVPLGVDRGLQRQRSRLSSR